MSWIRRQLVEIENKKLNVQGLLKKQKKSPKWTVSVPASVKTSKHKVYGLLDLTEARMLAKRLNGTVNCVDAKDTKKEYKVKTATAADNAKAKEAK